MKNKPSFFSIILLVTPIVFCLFFAWQLSGVKQEINNVQAQFKLINQIESIPISSLTKLSNKQVVVIQDQISKIQDFEDRRYNAITTQLNSFWSGVNGFLALIGIFFAMFSWYLTKQVESATKNVDKLDSLQKNIDDYIAEKSFELYEQTIKQDILQIIKAVKKSHSQETIKSAYDILRLRIKYVDMNDLIDIYNSFNKKYEKSKLSLPSPYFANLSYYLVLMLVKKPEGIPDNLIQEITELFKILRIEYLISCFTLINELCDTDNYIGKMFGDRMSKTIDLNILRAEILDTQLFLFTSEADWVIKDSIKKSTDYVFEKWFGQEIMNEAE